MSSHFDDKDLRREQSHKISICKLFVMLFCCCKKSMLVRRNLLILSSKRRLSTCPTLDQTHMFHLDLLAYILEVVSWKNTDRNMPDGTEDLDTTIREFNVRSKLNETVSKVSYDFCRSSVADIEAECQDDYMKIRVGFNGSFSGLLYSAGEFQTIEKSDFETDSLIFFRLSIGYAYDPGKQIHYSEFL